MLRLDLPASLERQRRRPGRDEVGPPRNVASRAAAKLRAGHVPVREGLPPERDALGENETGRHGEPPRRAAEHRAVEALVHGVHVLERRLLRQPRPARHEAELDMLPGRHVVNQLRLDVAEAETEVAVVLAVGDLFEQELEVTLARGQQPRARFPASNRPLDDDRRVRAADAEPALRLRDPSRMWKSSSAPSRLP